MWRQIGQGFGGYRATGPSANQGVAGWWLYFGVVGRTRRFAQSSSIGVRPPVSGTEIRRFSDDQSLFGGRWIVALLQAISVSLATGLALPLVVASAYVAWHTTDPYRVALIAPLAFGLWNFGALLAGRICYDRLRQLPWAFGGSVVRAAAMAVIAYLTYQAGEGDQVRLGSFFVAFGVFGFASGFTSAPVEALLQKSFESSSRAQLFRGRAFWGAIAGVAAGIVVRSVFESDGPATERAFSYLFIAAAGCLASAAFFTLLIKEPARRHSTARHGNQMALLAGLRDHPMQRYLLFRIVFAAIGMLDIFIVVYALRTFAFDWSFLGVYVLAFCGALGIALPFARALVKRRGGRAVLQTAAFLKLVSPLLLLTILYLQDSAKVADRISGDRFFLWMLAICFAAIGASQAFQATGNFHYLGEIAPATERSSFYTTTNIVLMCTPLFSFLGAWILDRWDYQQLFGAASAVALLAVLLSGILVDNRVVASRPATVRAGRMSMRQSGR